MFIFRQHVLTKWFKKYFKSILHQKSHVLWFSPPCSRAVCPSSKHTTTSFEHTTELVAMYQFEATDDPSSKHSDQITQQHTPDGRGISEHTDLIWERASRSFFDLREILGRPLRPQVLCHAHSDKFLRFFKYFLDWIQFLPLDRIKCDGPGGTSKFTKTTICCFFSLLF